MVNTSRRSSEQNIYGFTNDSSRLSNLGSVGGHPTGLKNWIEHEDFHYPKIRAKIRSTVHSSAGRTIADDVPTPLEKRLSIPSMKDMLVLQEKFSDSLSSIMSTINCATLDSSEDDASLLRDEDFYWPKGVELYSDDLQIEDHPQYCGPSNDAYKEHFCLSESSLVPLKSVED